MGVPIFRIVSRYREARRLRQVINTFLAYGIEVFVLPRTPWYLLKRWIWGKKVPSDPPQVRFRRALESLGPTFVKLGQVLSTRADILPEEWISELMKLRDEVPPSPWPEVQRILEEEFGEEWESLFVEVDPVPVGSASIAQVHRATLADGRKVVLKVRRPGIEEVVDLDLAVLSRIANILHRHFEELRIYDFPRLVDEFAFTIRREMDFRVEAANLERIGSVLLEEGVRVPEVHWDLTTKRVLVMDYVEGKNLEDADLSTDEACEMAQRLAVAFLRQVLEGGVFHADPHPANVIIGKDGNLYLIDFGMVGFLDRDMREFVKRVFVAIVRRDYDAIVDAYKRMGLVERMDERRFKLELMGLVDPYLSQSLERINVGEIVQKIVGISMRYGVRFPVEFLMLARAMLIVDGTVKQLCRGVSVIDIVSPYASEFVAGGFDWRQVKEEAAKIYKELLQLRDNLVVFSNLATEAALRIREEGVRVRVLQDEIRDRELRKLGNRLVVSTTGIGIFLAALFCWGFRVGWVKGYPVLPVVFLLGALALWGLSFFL